MDSMKMSVWYYREGDMLEVLWGFKPGYFTPTDDERVEKRLADDGEVLGFMIHGLSSIDDSAPLEFELASEAPHDDVANLTVKLAAKSLGISEGEMRDLAKGGRVRGAEKSGDDWLIPTPVELFPQEQGSTGPAGAADMDRG